MGQPVLFLRKKCLFSKSCLNYLEITINVTSEHSGVFSAALLKEAQNVKGEFLIIMADFIGVSME